jgi:hypothetical protein
MRAITGLPFRDMQCGFKLFETESAVDVFRRQKLVGFGFDVEDRRRSLRLASAGPAIPGCRCKASRAAPGSC